MIDTSAWDQLDVESPKAFAAFCQYRNLPPMSRSIDTAWRRIRSSELDSAKPTDAAELQRLPTVRAPKTWRDWSARHAWVARAMAWDAELDRKARDEIVKSHKAMLEKHRTLGSALVQRVAERMMSLSGSDLKVHDIPAWLKAGVAIERQAFALPDVVVQHSGSVEATAHVEHTVADSAYDTLVKLLLEAPDEALIATDRLSGRLASSSSLPRVQDLEGDASEGTAS